MTESRRCAAPTPAARARLSLEGLSVGDAFGQLVLDYGDWLFAGRGIPRGPWPWTDDTQMALSLVEALEAEGTIDPAGLMERFVRRYAAEPLRGYDWISTRALRSRATGGAADGLSWPVQGMEGNGAAMRVAPLGAFFAGDVERAASEALRSAAASHAEPDCQAGAVAVAVMAALVAHDDDLRGERLLGHVLNHVPAGPTRVGLEAAGHIAPHDHLRAVVDLGTGLFRASRDTVPFALWCAAHHRHDFLGALWEAVSGLGDTDTTCAIVGGIVALSAPEIPAWLLRGREPLPEAFRLFDDRTTIEGPWAPPAVPPRIQRRVGMLEKIEGIGDS